MVIFLNLNTGATNKKTKVFNDFRKNQLPFFGVLTKITKRKIKINKLRK